ncbi:leucyl/phenylalanyl-tRNA--protein transferase [Desulfobacterales bacterium HSG16]|nr:leucyl/phenylalanyl-tRNA--protein transferase [Desulfobacterales bacterium HSG16]
MTIFRLSDEIAFPPPQLAREDGLLAFGGDLSIDRLTLAYSMGIFPWYSEGEPIIWWSPDPRLVLFPQKFRLSKSLKKVIKRKKFNVTIDESFEQVIRSCAGTRTDAGDQTWIVEEMIDAYCRLHKAGFAHSVETWQDGELVGGLYGVSLGKSFFGESMFHTQSNASKVAVAALVDYAQKAEFDFIDCQVKTKHMVSLGAVEISRELFLAILKKALKFQTIKGRWRIDDQDRQLIF